MKISKAYLMDCAKTILAINPVSIVVQLLVTLPAIGAIVVAAIVSFIAPPASGLNTIPRLAAEFVYEKTQMPASTENHIVFLRCTDPAPEDMQPKPVTCQNLISEEVPLDKVATLFGNVAMIGYAFSWMIGFLLFGVYKMILPTTLKLIMPLRVFSR